MMLLPELNDMFFEPGVDAMLCDVEETDQGYEMNMAMPGVDKNDIKISLKNGYLNVNVEKHENHDEKNDEGHVIRQERYHGAMSRRFYVGEGLQPSAIKAKLENGELHLTVPKLSEKALEENNAIAIE